MFLHFTVIKGLMILSPSQHFMDMMGRRRLEPQRYNAV